MMPKAANLLAPLSCLLAAVALPAWPIANTFLTAGLASSACVAGITAIYLGVAGSYKILAGIGVVLGLAVAFSWLTIMFLALTAASGMPL